MKFLIIGLNYLPESTSIGPYTADLAEYLDLRGHEVEVITGFPLAPQWRIWDGYRGRWFMREKINRIPLLRTFLYVPSQPGKAINRIFFDLSFSFSALLGGISVGQVDLIIVISPPLQLGLTGWALGLFKPVPFFFHIQDLVPDAAVAVGALDEGSWVTRIARRVEGFVYKHAGGIGVISEGFRKNMVAKGVSPEKVEVLPNYIDLEFLKTSERNNGFRKLHGISPDKFLVMYSGSIALKQGLHTFVEAAAEFEQKGNVLFYLIGEGPYVKELQMMAKKLSQSNIQFLPLQPRETLPLQLGAADVLVITQKRAVTDMVFPGKLLYYMAAGRPILAAVSSDSETGQFITKHRVGIVVPPEEPRALAEAIRYLQQNRGEIIRLGENGRRVVEKHFDRRFVLEKFVNHLERLVKDRTHQENEIAG